MSHFTVMVIGDNADAQLAPFNEDLELPRHIVSTKQQLIEKGKKEIESYKNGTYKEFLANPEKYAEECKNERHVNYVRDEFPLKLEWSDEQIYQDQIQYEESENIGIDGEIYTTSNDNAKWDWYQLGGRWAGRIKLKDGVKADMSPDFSWGWDDAEKLKVLEEGRCDYAFKKDIANIDELSCFALLKDGVWYERGGMGWWGIVSNEKSEEEWDGEFRRLIKDLPDDTLISIYDCHI